MGSEIRSAMRMLSHLFVRSKNSGQERYRKAALTSAASVANQLLQVATGLISVPLVLHHVGTEQFGLWMAISTALTFITFSDLGVGIGLQDRMSKLIGVGQQRKARQAFFTALVFITLLALVLLMLSALIIPKAPLSSLLSLRTIEAQQEIGPTTFAVVCVLVLGLVSGIVQRAYSAIQEGFVVAVIQSVARCLALAALVLAIRMDAGLPALVLIIGAAAAALNILVGLPLLLYRNPWILTAKVDAFGEFDLVGAVNVGDIFSFEALGQILKVGIFGLGAALAVYLVNNSIIVLISLRHGAVEVADYSLLLRILSIPLLLLTYLLLPLWPAIADAHAKRDGEWIKTLYIRYRKVTALVALSVLLFIPFGRSIILIWTGDPSVVPSWGLLFACVGFAIIGCWNALVSTFLNGLSKFRSQATAGLLLAAGFAGLAALLPDGLPKSTIVWVIALGYLVRCAVLQARVNQVFRSSGFVERHIPE